MEPRLVRQSFLGPHSDAVLRKARVGIIGLCGGGSHIAQQLAHVGVGAFWICDGDAVALTNLNRLVGARYDDALATTPKILIAKRVIKDVNPDAIVVTSESKWQHDALRLRECDVVFGCVDSFLERLQLETECRRFYVPYIDIGMDVHEYQHGFAISGQVAVSIPGFPCLRCQNVISDRALKEEGRRYGAAGGRPQVVWPNGLLASAAVGAFMRLLLKWFTEEDDVLLWRLEGNSQTLAPDHLLHLRQRCSHFSGFDDVGEPLWIPEA